MKVNLDDCVIRLGNKEWVSSRLAEILDEVNVKSIHIFTLPPEKPAGLHCHEYDEYWLFIEGKTLVTLRSENGKIEQYNVGVGDLIITPKGVEHGHAPSTLTKYIQFSSKLRPGSRLGHLKRSVEDKKKE